MSHRASLATARGIHLLNCWIVACMECIILYSSGNKITTITTACPIEQQTRTSDICITGPLWRESTGDPLFPLTRGGNAGSFFRVMTSLRSTITFYSFYFRYWDFETDTRKHHENGQNGSRRSRRQPEISLPLFFVRHYSISRVLSSYSLQCIFRPFRWVSAYIISFDPLNTYYVNTFVWNNLLLDTCI